MSSSSPTHPLNAISSFVLPLYRHFGSCVDFIFHHKMNVILMWFCCCCREETKKKESLVKSVCRWHFLLRCNLYALWVVSSNPEFSVSIWLFRKCWKFHIARRTNKTLPKCNSNRVYDFEIVKFREMALIEDGSIWWVCGIKNVLIAH